MSVCISVHNTRHTGADLDNLQRLLEDGQKSKYSIRAVKFLQVTLIKQSNIKVDQLLLIIIKFYI